jgi:hypothetical protein
LFESWCKQIFQRRGNTLIRSAQRIKIIKSFSHFAAQYKRRVASTFVCGHAWSGKEFIGDSYPQAILAMQAEKKGKNYETGSQW